MPNWGEHFLIAKKLSKKLKVQNENLFLFGNILPDIQNGWLVKGVTHIEPHNITHYYKNVKEYLKNGKSKKAYEIFYEEYKLDIEKPIVLGYLAHLMADYLWNYKFYNERCIRENEIAIGYVDLNGKKILKDKDGIKIDKQNEFRIFQDYIYRNYDLDLPENETDLVEKSNEIDVINLNDEDIKKVIDYIGKCKEDAKNSNEELKIFRIEELEKLIDETVDFIVDFLNEN